MDGMGLVYQEEEKLIDTGFNIIMPGLSGHISSFFLKGILLQFTATSCQNYWCKQESRCINNAVVELEVLCI